VPRCIRGGPAAPGPAKGVWALLEPEAPGSAEEALLLEQSLLGAQGALQRLAQREAQRGALARRAEEALGSSGAAAAAAAAAAGAMEEEE
jgi:hypothetical protein